MFGDDQQVMNGTHHFGRPADKLYVAKFDAPANDPESSEGHQIALTLSNRSQRPYTWRLEIREGYRDEGNPGTLIATRVHQAPPGFEGPIVDELTLEEGQRVRHFDDLYLRSVREDG